MNACPTHQQLEQFVSGRLSDFDRTAVDTHVQTCVHCRQTMSTLTQGESETRIWNIRPKEAAPAAGVDELPAELREHPRYHVLELLAVGGMGAVYKAQHKLLERTVVLKVIRQDVLSRPDLVQRFLREAKIAASMSHPNIVTLYEAEQLGKAYFLVMEYLAGTDLEDVIEERGPLSVAEACAWVRQAAIGLQYIHERGLVHRDIKPSNLFLVNGGVSGGAADTPRDTHDSTTHKKPTHHSTTHQIKILDLGLAVLRSGETSASGLTEKGQILGTIDYMAPEQWEDSRGVDIRADIYSLGCTLYHLLAGKPPFDASQYSSMMKQMWAHAQAPVPPLSQSRSDVPPEVVAVVERMLAKKPADRYATPAEVAAALEPHAAAIADQGSSAIRRLGGAKSTGTVITSRSTAISRLLPPRLRNKRPLLAFCASLVLLAGATALFFLRSPTPVAVQREPIKVGILHSRTGTMAISEKSVIDATLFAIEELNANGGVLGRKVEAIVEDGASDPATFARKAEKLISQDKVATLFGCWTSASRKMVKPVVERHNHLLFYPVQYEGLEESPNIVYVGAAPNQQIIPAMKWSCAFLKKMRLFIVGSDYVFPRAASAIMRDQATALGAEIVGEEYVPMASTDMSAAVKKIQERKPDMILNTINGDSNVAFFRSLRKAGLTAAVMPIMSFSISEEELSSLGPKEVQGNYAAWNYFQSIDLPENQDFVARFRARFGPERVLSDPMEAAYVGVHLWAQAVAAAGSDDVSAIRGAIHEQSFQAPEGKVTIDPQNHHVSKFIRIGKITEAGRFDVVYCSDAPIKPIPYPTTRPRAEWDALLTDLHLLWGGQWENPNQ